MPLEMPSAYNMYLFNLRIANHVLIIKDCDYFVQTSGHIILSTLLYMLVDHTQRRVQPDQCYFTVQITGSNFECSLQCNSTVIVFIS